MICKTLLFLLILLTSAPTGPPPHPHPHEKSELQTSKTPTPRPSAQSSAARFSTSRIVDRTIQALRQANLSVRKREGSRPEVLLVCKPPWLFQTEDGLRSTRIQTRRGIVFSQLQVDARNSGRDLLHQSRVTITKRGVVATPCRRLFARQRSPCLVFSWPTWSSRHYVQDIEKRH